MVEGRPWRRMMVEGRPGWRAGGGDGRHQCGTGEARGAPPSMRNRCALHGGVLLVDGARKLAAGAKLTWEQTVLVRGG
jgi:hypothetical protein